MTQPVIYWIDYEGPGRLAILARPQGDEALSGVIQGWREAGVDAVVSLLTDSDNRYLGLSAEGDLCRGAGLQFVSFPIQDCGVPESFELALELVKKLNGLSVTGKTIGFHCHGCIGRAPLIASCVLMYSGKSAEEAFERVSIARGYPIPEAREQFEWGKEFAQQLNLQG